MHSTLPCLGILCFVPLRKGRGSLGFPGLIPSGSFRSFLNQEIFSMRKILQWFYNPPPDAPRATILLRLMAGSVFLWEGILKFVYANQGVGRFTKLGFPFPDFTAFFVGGLETVGGLLILVGLGARFVAAPFLIELVVAMLSTKIGLYLGTSPLPLPPSPPQTGFWAVLHEVRSEYAQLLTVAFLLWAGPGSWSLDARRARKRTEDQREEGAWSEIGSVSLATRLPALLGEPAVSAGAGRSLTSAAGSEGRHKV
jgi:uncharacterized membrane protein YphA (DoxX/SURF4 family)